MPPKAWAWPVVGITSLMLGGTLIAIIVATHGHVLFTLDDPYIDLALAERLAWFGHYGINLDEMAAPSSSILYPFLLVPAVSLGLGAGFAWLLCAAGALLSAWFFAVICEEAGISLSRLHFAALAGLSLLFCLCFNLVGVAATGLEHALHIAASLGCILGLIRLFRLGRVSWLLMLCACAAPALRYEGASLWLGVVMILLWLGQWKSGLGVLLAGCLVVLGFSLFLHHAGLGWLPSSVIAKTMVIARASEATRKALAMQVCGTEALCFCLVGAGLLLCRVSWAGLACLVIGLMGGAAGIVIAAHGTPLPPDGAAHGALAVLRLFAWQAEITALTQYGVPQLCLLSALLLPGGIICWRRRAYDRVMLAALGLLIAVAHLAFGKFGWFSRYEIYALMSVSALVLCVYAENCHAWLACLSVRRFMGLAATICILFLPYIARFGVQAAAAGNIYRQQYQLHRFERDFAPGPIAVSDLGLTSYQNRNEVLDLFGLGSATALRLRRNSADGAWMDELARAHNVPLVMISPAEFSAIPGNWLVLGQLHCTGPLLSLGHPDVAFYATSSTAAEKLRPALVLFAKGLPSGDNLQ